MLFAFFWFRWSEVGTRDHLIERRREDQLLRWGHFSDSWPALRLFSVWWGLGRGYWEVALRKHPPLMRPTQLEPVCPCATALRPLAEATRTAGRGSAGLHVQLKDVRTNVLYLGHWPKIKSFRSFRGISVHEV